MLIDQLIFVVVALSALCFAFFVYLKPLDAFELQRKFYALINWRIEPISLQKEIRNTKLMGIFLIVIVIAACLYKFFG